MSNVKVSQKIFHPLRHFSHPMRFFSHPMRILSHPMIFFSSYGIFLRQAWDSEKCGTNDLKCPFSILFVGVVDSVIPNSRYINKKVGGVCDFLARMV
jgi:hypothetical protein